MQCQTKKQDNNKIVYKYKKIEPQRQHFLQNSNPNIQISEKS